MSNENENPSAFNPVITRVDFNLSGSLKDTHYSYLVAEGVIHTHGPDQKTPLEHAMLAQLGSKIQQAIEQITTRKEAP